MGERVEDEAVETPMIDDPTSLYRRAYGGAIRLALALVDVPATAEDFARGDTVLALDVTSGEIAELPLPPGASPGLVVLAP